MIKMDSDIFDLIKKANETTPKKHGNEISLERAIFLSWWCDKGDCAFCYMSTQKDKIKDPTKARRNVHNIYAEAEMCKRLNWNIEFLSGGYKSFTTAEIKEIATTIKNITGDSVWLNTGITDELEEYGSEIKGITGAVEVANPELHQKVCPSKSLDKISNMLDIAGDLGFQKAITVILGLGETLDDVDYLIDYIKDHKIVFSEIAESMTEDTRRVFLQWIAQANMNSQKKGRTEYGQEYQLFREKGTCILKCEDGDLTMPSYILEFK